MPRLSAAALLALASCLAASAPAGRGQDNSAADLFESRIRPLLAGSCYSCHSGANTMGGLRLDSRRALLQGGKSGAAAVAGDPGASLLIQAVRHTHARLKMPLGGARLKSEEIDALADWVRSGLVWPETAEAAATARPAVISPEARAFWAFRPVGNPAPPPVAARGWPKSPIDRFVLARLEARGLAPAPAAPRRVLLRRASFDLTGLPPTPEEVDAFEADPDTDAFARVVDRLLASPHYGERWGRHWLDVARYSDDKLDPTGDTPYENAYRYRDWVIRALNEDMPYDTFVKAQLAGDSLDAENPERYAAGLGFFGLSPQFQDDRVDATTRGFLGLTVACAQCHDHKFDPIPTRDYYSLAGVFKSTELHELPVAPAPEVAAWDAAKARLDKAEAELKAFVQAQASQLAEILATRTARYLLATRKIEPPPGPDSQAVADVEKLDRETLERWVEHLKRPSREHPFLDEWTRAVALDADSAALVPQAERFQELALAVAAEKRAVDDKNHVLLGGKNDRNLLAGADLVSLERDRYFLWRDLFGERGIFYHGDRKLDRFLSGDWKSHLESLRAEAARLRAALPRRYPFLHAIRDVAEPRDVRVEIRGSSSALGEVAPRRFLAILCDGEPPPFLRGSGRLELADAIASPTNPLTARVMVNRIWQHHFGAGLVRTASNFGRLGEAPSHPELLDYLARRFIDGGWSVKRLHREIMLSATYAMGATHSAKGFDVDPENRLLWRASRRRLDVEALRDALLAVSGRLDPAAGGPPLPLGDDNRRRTVYGFVSRKKLDPLLASFDFANPNNTSEARIETNVPVQRLFFANSGFVAAAARQLADRLSGRDDTARIERAYRLVLQRGPSKAELRLGLDFLRRGNQALAEYAAVLLGSNEFLFIE